jgi:hypothetical protein
LSKAKDSEGTPIVIYQKLYEELSQNAKKRSMTIKKYATNLLESALKSYKYLDSKYPNISYKTTVGTTIILQDSTDKKNVKPISVKAKKDSEGFVCETDSSENCEHVTFAMFCPDAFLSLTNIENNDGTMVE